MVHDALSLLWRLLLGGRLALLHLACGGRTAGGYSICRRRRHDRNSWAAHSLQWHRRAGECPDLRRCLWQEIPLRAAGIARLGGFSSGASPNVVHKSTAISTGAWSLSALPQASISANGWSSRAMRLIGRDIALASTFGPSREPGPQSAACGPAHSTSRGIGAGNTNTFGVFSCGLDRSLFSFAAACESPILPARLCHSWCRKAPSRRS